MKNKEDINISINNVLLKSTCFEVVLFYLRFYKGLKLHDISDKFGISHEAVRVNLNKIARRIKDEV